MTKNKTSPLMDETTSDQREEYQFKDEEISDGDYIAQPSNTQSKKGFFGVFKNKKLWVVLIAVIAIVIITKIMQSRSKIDEVVEPNVPNETQQTQTFKPEVVAPSSKVQIQPEQPQPEIQGQLNELKHQNAIENTQLIQLQRTVASMRGDMLRNERSLTNLNNSVQVLTQQVQQLTTKLETQTAKPVEAKPVTKKKADQKPLDFSIKAMMPGRAWLLANNNKTITVKVGDQLKDFGMVQLIDVDRGIVLTSSGRIIRYGKNDQ